MNLSKAQCQEIRDYVQSQGVSFVALEHEIVDHISSGVEDGMQQEGFSFRRAFESEKMNWRTALDSYCLPQRNIVVNIPQVVFKRYWMLIKRMYTRAVLMTLTAVLPLFLLVWTGVFPSEILNRAFGYLYLVTLVIIAMAYSKMKAQKLKTVHRSIYQATMGYFMAWLMVFNPLWGSMYRVCPEHRTMALFLTIHIFLISFSFSFIRLYKAHERTRALFSSR